MTPRVRKIPQRTCIGCGGVKNKKELIRIARTPEGEVVIDFTGKKSGRGTYTCPRLECLESVFKGNKLSAKLNIDLSSEEKTRLREELRQAILNE